MDRLQGGAKPMLWKCTWKTSNTGQCSSKDTHQNQFTDSSGEKTQQLCTSSHQPVSCVRVYGRTPGTAEAAVLFSSSQLKKLAGSCVIIPSLVICLVPAAEWSFLCSREATAAKMGLPLPSVSVEKRLGAGQVCALSHHKPLSFES